MRRRKGKGREKYWVKLNIELNQNIEKYWVKLGVNDQPVGRAIIEGKYEHISTEAGQILQSEK